MSFLSLFKRPQHDARTLRMMERQAKHLAERKAYADRRARELREAREAFAANEAGKGAA